MRLLLFLPLLMLWTGIEGGNVIPVLLESAIGSTTLHRKQSWKFDPDAGQRLNRDFELEHGHKSVVLIEKLGLGIDGRREERRQEQAIRDSIPLEDPPQPIYK